MTTCTTCAGTGECQACGDGKRNVWNPDTKRYEEIDCTYCSGSGDCGDCDGSGG